MFLYLINSSYIVRITGFNGVSITDMEYALTSDPDTWISFSSVALEAPSSYDLDNGYAWATHKFVGFGETATGNGNNLIFFTEAIGPGGVSIGDPTDFHGLELPSDWSYLINDTGLSTATVALDLFTLNHEASYALDTDASEFSGGLAGTANGTTFVQGAVVGMDRSYAQFNGTSGEILLDQSFGDIWGSDASFTMWFRTEATSGMMYMARESYSGSSKSYFSSDIKAGGTLEAFWRSKQGNESTAPAWAGTVINDGEWHMVAYVRDGSDLHVYIDGNLEGTLTNLAGSFLANVPVRIGSYSANSSNPSGWLNGDVDEMNMWSRALSATEVADLYAAQIHLNDGLIAKYVLDDNSDDSVGTNNLSLTGGSVSYVGYGTNQAAVEFNFGELESDDVVDLTGEFTISFWAKEGTPHVYYSNNYSSFFKWGTSTGSYFDLYLLNGKIRTMHNNAAAGWGDNRGSVAVPAGWNHYAMTIDPSTGSKIVYLNGVAQALTGPAFTGTFAASQKVFLGNTSSDPAFRSNGGQMDEVQIWNRVLSETEIGYIHSIGASEAPAPELVGHWSFDNGDATADVGADGTNNGATFETVGGRSVATIDSGDYIRVDNAGADFATEDFSVALWFYNDGNVDVDWGQLIGNQNIVGASYTGWSITRHWGDATLFTTQTGNGSAWSNVAHANPFTLPLNTWTHVVMVREGTQLKVYLNGADTGYTGPAHETIAYSGDFLQVGSAPFSSSTASGKYDDVRIYSAALSAQEVADLHTATTVADPMASSYMLFGYKPLFATAAEAEAASPDGSGYHVHNLDGSDHFMPNGLTMGDNQFHGTFGLEARYPMDTDMNDSVGSNNGTANGSVDFPNDSARDAMEILSDAAIATIPDTLNIGSGPYTVNVWIKPDNFDQAGTIITDHVTGSIYPSFHVSYNTSGQVNVYHRSANSSPHQVLTSTGSLTLNQWQLLTIAWDGSVMKIYFDGVLDSQGAVTNTTWTSTVDYRVGSDTYAGIYVRGMLDDLTIHNRAMPDSEVAYWHTTTTITPTLVGHWSFDSDATDSSSGYNGTVTAGSFESGEGRDFISFERESTGIVSLPDSLDSIVAGDYTMSAWVKLDTIQDTDFGYFGVMTIDGVGLSVTLGYPSVTSNGGDTTHHFSGVGLMSVDTWYHLVLVQEGSDKKLYLDGVLLGTNPTQPSNSWGIGTDNNIAKGYSSFDGDIDDVRIYSIALSDQEVADLHTATTVVPPGPVLTIKQTDSYGDGWNNGSLSISDSDGNVLGTFSGPPNGAGAGGFIEETLGVSDNARYTWSAVAGSYPGEISFIISDSNGELINVPNLSAHGSLTAHLTSGHLLSHQQLTHQ